jgi:lipid A 3-O-deacylase
MVRRIIQAAHAATRKRTVAGSAALALAALTMAWQAPAAAQDSFFDDWEFNMRTDNDTLLNTDRYYTNGLWLNALRVDGDHWHGWGIANETYTPSDISLLPDEIPRDDRPYAGWTYLSYFKGQLNPDDSAVVWEFTAGCIGPCSRAERFQSFWHSKVVNVPKARGWASQIEDEVGLQVRRARQKPMRYWLDDDRGLRADLARTTEFRIGNIVTDAKIGLIGRWRLGNMRGFFDGAGIDDLIPQRSVVNPERGPSPWTDRVGRGWLWSDEAFVFGRIEGSLVAHNSTIEGGLFNEDSPFTQDSRRAVIHSELGIKFVWRRISFAMSWNSMSTDWAGHSWSLNQHNWISFYGVIR